MLLAEAAPAGTAQFIEIATYLIVCITAAVALWRMLKKPEPAETEIGGQPIKVKFAAQFATKEELQSLEGRVEKLEQKIDDNFDKLNENRSRSIAGLHQKIEEKTDAIRREVKSDNEGLHGRITEILKAFSKLEGAFSTAMKNSSNHPFGS